MKMDITKLSRATAHALSVCMNVRTSHFIMQTAPACTAADAGVIRKKSDVEKHHDGKACKERRYGVHLYDGVRRVGQRHYQTRIS